MALFDEDFRRCPNCGHYEFEEKRYVVLAKTGGKTPVPAWAQERPTANGSSVYVTQERYVYLCAHCGRELDVS